MGCRTCDEVEPRKGGGYVWKCVRCGRTIPINEETYKLFADKPACPKCGDILIVSPKKGG